jgi:hypothetical protein
MRLTGGLPSRRGHGASGTSGQRSFPGARDRARCGLLTCEPLAYDLVLHALALHWANDPVGQLVQARRALVPDGLFLCATFWRARRWRSFGRAGRGGGAMTGGLSPRVAPMGEIRDLGALLQRAGFALPVADNLTQASAMPAPRDLIRDLRAWGRRTRWPRGTGGSRRGGCFQDAMRLYSAAFPAEEGRARDVRARLPDRLGAVRHSAETAAPGVRHGAARRCAGNGRTSCRRPGGSVTIDLGEMSICRDDGSASCWPISARRTATTTGRCAAI